MLLCKEDIHSITHNLTCLEKSEFFEFVEVQQYFKVYSDIQTTFIIIMKSWRSLNLK